LLAVICRFFDVPYDPAKTLNGLEMIEMPPQLGQALDQVGHCRMALSFVRRVRRRNGSASAARSCTSRTKAWSRSSSAQKTRRPESTIRRARCAGASLRDGTVDLVAGDVVLEELLQLTWREVAAR
jgi:hypothetical protein